uniref:Uncharacterized protein n=1 Tax=Corethron hystrix TaxID=216773 RepID=A0A6U5DUK2_9STRA|mmetsp:Transcript_14142/g.30925  ORF Transcript_14142/g.30925 Transcript_14142/m.30925 type:complete len:427 (+) Transcript_14142:74-1354(+)|eukprot:CAMPEP_0113308808 /NCGR_PEP_ID=MMETSP0010_2-20120614/7111_1 /TAXON_ID=216773 ORGANISM="Corethron hystrix, Strain 308" /NCGR_SAMPLE_ID=MMETSP0010_2 /ASSEMBLY_ACC=CAM_ASM_000155 /LENGTH=426 /DNA_ID=CAMNT_0000163949 /DNA_START=59 /DNA_END=1339 /DNA_ORIENTATION=- /assembly_acc=CAM_ASM_000155
MSNAPLIFSTAVVATAFFVSPSFFCSSSEFGVSFVVSSSSTGNHGPAFATRPSAGTTIAFVPHISLAQRRRKNSSPLRESHSSVEIFEDFSSFLLKTQDEFIRSMEELDGSGQKFSRDGWGSFADGSDGDASAGGFTRVIQGGDVIEKGAASVTIVREGTLSAERAAAISGRRRKQREEDDAEEEAEMVPREGDIYRAAALSVVLHSRSPMVPTFRSDVRIFVVSRPDGDGGMLAWYGGGADLTPYYLFEDDVVEFHACYRDLVIRHFGAEDRERGRNVYDNMKADCDKYFYLPARAEHRGTGGIFFDDLDACTELSSDGPLAGSFVKAVAETWIPSYRKIVSRRKDTGYEEAQRRWQLLRRGRYLEFNLLYDRGVKFGLAGANPRVEGVMVSAPPMIAWEYNHDVKEGSEEWNLMQVLKSPKQWV